MKTHAISDLTSGGRMSIIHKVKETGEPVVLTRHGVWHVAVVPIGYVEQEHKELPQRIANVVECVYGALRELKTDARKVGDDKAVDALDFALALIRLRLEAIEPESRGR